MSPPILELVFCPRSGADVSRIPDIYGAGEKIVPEAQKTSKEINLMKALKFVVRWSHFRAAADRRREEETGAGLRAF
jgi:hypothetical protein